MPKVQVYWFSDGMDGDERLLVALLKEDEGFSAPALDDEDTVQDLMDDGKIMRGPWAMQTQSTRSGGVYGMAYKTMTLKNLPFDIDEDLLARRTTSFGG